MGAVFLLCTVGAVYTTTEYLHLHQVGQVASATVQSQEHLTSGWVVEYAFRSPSGEIVTGRTPIAEAAGPLSALAVVFDPADPRHHWTVAELEEYSLGGSLFMIYGIMFPIGAGFVLLWIGVARRL